MNRQRMKTVQEVALMYNVSTMTIYNWMKRGLPYHEVPKTKTMMKMLNIDEVTDWVKENVKERQFYFSSAKTAEK